MKAHRFEFRVAKMAKVLRVSRSGYYAWFKRPKSKYKQANDKLLAEIKRVYEASRKTYGSPRVTKQLQLDGITCGKNRVSKIMKNNHIYSITRRKFKATTNSNHRYPVAENLLNQQFETTCPNKIWLSDITYIPTEEGWLYLACIKDVYDKKIVGWSMDKHMTKELVMNALNMEIMRRNPSFGLIHHSDRGVQYASYDYQRLLKTKGIICSMSRSGNPYDNAPMESFFSILKKELIHHKQYKTRDQAKHDIFDYIETFYNSNRLNSAIGYKTPNQCEKQRLSA